MSVGLVRLYCFQFRLYCFRVGLIVLIVGLIVLIENVFEMFVNESRACGRVCGPLSILRQGFNRLVHSCPIVRIVKYSL